MIHDFTIRPDSACHACGYLLTGLRTTGRCPECSTHVVESLYLAAERRRFRGESQASNRLTIAVLRTSWRSAPWLGLTGLAAIAFSMLFSQVATGADPAIGEAMLAATASSLTMYGALRFLERLGLAGFVSRRAIALLVVLLHLFALGIVLLPPFGGRGAAASAVFLLAPLPLMWLLPANAPDSFVASSLIFALSFAAWVGWTMLA
jgi:hypothetical protein